MGIHSIISFIIVELLLILHTKIFSWLACSEKIPLLLHAVSMLISIILILFLDCNIICIILTSIVVQNTLCTVYEVIKSQ